VIKEANTMGGLLLVHQEIDDGTIVPCFIAADQVQTPKEGKPSSPHISILTLPCFVSFPVFPERRISAHILPYSHLANAGP
jgi:hypothetical protein